MRHLYTFGHAGGAGGVDDVGQVLVMESQDLAIGVVLGLLACVVFVAWLHGILIGISLLA